MENKYIEDNVFEIKSVNRSINHYVIHGNLVKGSFDVGDYVKIKEKDFYILEAYIDKIKLMDKFEINSTNETYEKSLIFYLNLFDEDIKITNHHIIVKEQKIMKM